MASEVGAELTDRAEGFYTRGTKRGYFHRIGEYEVNVIVDRATRQVEIGESLRASLGYSDQSVDVPDMPDDITKQILPNGMYRRRTVDKGILALITAYSDWRVNRGPVKSEPNLNRFLQNIGPHLGTYFPKE